MTNYRKQWQEQGFLVVRGVLPPPRIANLLELCEDAYAQWREESSEGSEPNYHHFKPDAWSIVHLTHPKYFRAHPERLPVLLDAIADPFALEIIEEIFQEAPLFSQCNYYIDPPSQPLLRDWRREIVGQELLDLLDGKRTVVFDRTPGQPAVRTQ